MENELTQYHDLAYPVISRSTDVKLDPPTSIMEENAELIPVTENIEQSVNDEELILQAERLAENSSKAALKWTELFDLKRKRGEEVTKDDYATAKKAIDRGEYPTLSGGSGDGVFENFPVEEFEGTPLEDAARLIKSAGENNRVTKELLGEVVSKSHEVGGMGDDALSNKFIMHLTRLQMPDLPRQQEARGAIVDELLKRRVGRSREERERRSTNPESIQEVALVIINDEGAERWGPDGRFPLIEPIKDKNGNPVLLLDPEGNPAHDRFGQPKYQFRVKQENFVRWFRERMMYQHNNNARDSKLQMGNSVGIINEWGTTINIFKMHELRAKFFRDENTEEIYDDLAEQMKYELWLFGNMRNYDLMYQEAMGSDSELPKLINGIHNLEEITRPGSMSTIFKMAKDYGKERAKLDDSGNVVRDEHGDIVMESVVDTAIGDSARLSYEIYYSISDYIELQELLGSDSILFKRKGFVNALKIIEGLESSDSEDKLSPDAIATIDRIFPNGKINPSAFIREINPFNEKQKREFNIRLSREMVRLAVSDKYNLDYGLNYSPQKETVYSGGVKRKLTSKRDFYRNDLEYAETWAWVLTRWTGAAARNDTGAVGWDAQTKAMKLRDYRVRQADISRAGSYGNEYDLPVLKSVVSDFFNGILIERKAGDTDNITPYEVFKKLDDVDDQIRKLLGERNEEDLTNDEKKELQVLQKTKIDWINRLEFPQLTQRGFVGDHVNRGFEVFHSTMGAEEMRLEEIVKWDPFRGVIMDRGKFEEQVKEKFLKPLRYAFNTYGQLDFGKTTRIQIGTDKNGLPTYKEVTNAEKFFGPEVLREIRPLADKWFNSLDEIQAGELQDTLQKKGINFSTLSADEKKAVIWREYLSGPGRSRLWKQAAMTRLAAHIRSHRQFGNGYTPFTGGMVEMLYDALESIKGIDLVEGDEATKVDPSERFLSKADINWIRAYSGTTKKSLLFKEYLLKDVGGGVAKGTWEGLTVFFKEIFH